MRVRQSASPASGASGGRLIFGIIVAVIALISYFSSRSYNDITGENQYLSMTADQEIALGAQAAPQMIQEYGGLYPDQAVQQLVDDVGNRLVTQSVANDTPWEFEFYVLDDTQTINAFALPGGQIFITQGLLSRFDSPDEVAGVLAHEIVHVLARHSAQQMAKNELTNGLVGAVGVASGNASAAQTAAVIAQLVNMRYGRADETQSDTLGVCLMFDAGYDPQGMVEVMQILQEASGGASQPEFFSSHPNPENRIREIQEAIAEGEGACPD